MTVLIAAATLPDELALLLDLCANGFTEGDRRLADVHIDLELAQQSTDDVVNLRFTRSIDDRHFRFAIATDTQ